MIDKSHEAYRAYREAARRCYEDVGRVESEHIKVPEHANVHICEDGAFVEAIVWVPKEQLTLSLVLQNGGTCDADEALRAKFERLTDAKDACQEYAMKRNTTGAASLYHAVWHLWNRTEAGPL